MTKGAVHFYDQLMLGCEEKNLGRGLPPTRFFSNKADLRICSSHLGKTPHCHIPYYKGMEVLQLQQVHITAATLTYNDREHLYTVAATLILNDSNIYTWEQLHMKWQHLYIMTETFMHSDNIDMQQQQLHTP